MSRNFIRKNWVLGGALAALASVTLSADTSSTFNIAGTITITKTGISWTGNESPFTADTSIIGPGASGLYAGLDGTNVTIEPVPDSDPVGSLFSGQLFLGFSAAPGLSALDLNFISPGILGAAGCTSSPPAAGETCTPAGSPLNFLNTSAASTSVLFTLNGQTADGSGAWQGDFSTQFSESYQALLAGIAGGGSASNTYSATFTVTTEASPVPEPSAIPVSLLGIGLLALRSRRVASRFRLPIRKHGFILSLPLGGKQQYQEENNNE